MWANKGESFFKGTKKLLFWFLDVKGVEIEISYFEGEKPILLALNAN